MPVRGEQAKEPRIRFLTEPASAPMDETDAGAVEGAEAVREAVPEAELEAGREGALETEPEGVIDPVEETGAGAVTATVAAWSEAGHDTGGASPAAVAVKTASCGGGGDRVCGSHC